MRMKIEGIEEAKKPGAIPGGWKSPEIPLNKFQAVREFFTVKLEPLPAYIEYFARCHYSRPHGNLWRASGMWIRGVSQNLHVYWLFLARILSVIELSATKGGFMKLSPTPTTFTLR